MAVGDGRREPPAVGPRHVLYPPGWNEAGVVAQTDWATGCIRWFIDREDWDAAFRQARDAPAELTPRQWFILEANAHELTHVLQIATTGFAYVLSYRLFSIVQAAAEGSNGSLEAVYESRHRYTGDMQAVLEVLDRPGPGGITTRAIIEGVAYVQQKNAYYRGLTLDEMLHLLTEDLQDGTYRSAFDLAVNHLGDDAMRHFVHAANLSLYTTEPQMVFVSLLEEFATRASKLNVESNHRIGTELLGRRFPGMILGTAESLINTGMKHRALGLNAVDLASHVRRKPGAYASLYAANLDSEVSDLLHTTTYFPPGVDGRTPITFSRSDLRLENDGFSMSVLRYYNAVSDILVSSLAPPSPGPVQFEPTAPRSHGLAETPSPILVTIGRRHTGSQPQLAKASQLIAKLSSDPYLARAYRGMIALQFEDTDWHPDLMDPEVRAGLRDLFDQFPHLLYFLLRAEPVAEFPLNLAWAAYAPQAQVREPGSRRIGIQMRGEALPVAFRALCAAADFAEQQGESRRTMLVHLEGLPPAVAAGLRSLVLR